MRILMLAQFFQPILGGEERHVQDLCTELIQRGHDVAIVTLWKNGLPSFEVDRGLRIYRVKSSLQEASWLYHEEQRPHVPPIPDPKVMRELQRIIETERPEIVHGHNWFVYSFLPIKRWSGAKLVVTLHDYSLSCAKKRYVYHNAPCTGPGPMKCLNCAVDHYGLVKGVPTVAAKLIMKQFEYGLVDMFVPVSSATAEGNGLTQHKVPYRVIPNFVPPSKSSPTSVDQQLLHQLPKGDYLLFVGDLCHDKGVDVLVEAYGGLRQAPPLVLIGRKCVDTPEVLPDNVTVLHSWPHDAVLEAWRRSIIGVAPSTWPEPFGIVVIEAMAAGKPVIASRIGGVPDIVIDGQTGLLVRPNDRNQLQKAIEHLVSDPALRAKMGKAGRERVTLFHKDVVVPQIEQVYADVLNKVISPVPQIVLER